MIKLVQQRRAIFTTEFARMIYSIPPSHSDSHQSDFEELKEYFPNVELVVGLPKASDLMDNMLPKLLLIDDQEFI